MNIYEKIQAVANEVMTIEKDMTVGSEKYGYKAVSDLSVTKAVKEAEAKHKLVSIPSKQELVNQEVLKKIDKDGRETYNYSFLLKMTTKIVDIEKPEDFIEVESFGHGLDIGDKGFGKASTYARKYALLNAYKIATGEDPDKDPSKTEQAPNTHSEKRILVENYLTTDLTTLRNWLQHFNIGSIEDASESQIGTMYTTLQKRGKL